MARRTLRPADFPAVFWQLFARILDQDVGITYHSRESAEDMAAQLRSYRRVLLHHSDDIGDCRTVLIAVLAHIEVDGSTVRLYSRKRAPEGLGQELDQ